MVQDAPYWDESLSVSLMFTFTSNAAGENETGYMRDRFSREAVRIATSTLAIRLYV
jgi:hypothetical protein